MREVRHPIIEDVLMTYLREECLPKETTALPGYDDDLIEAGIVDSAGLVSFIAFIEREFDLVIADEDLLPEHFTTLARIARFIRERRDGHNG